MSSEKLKPCPFCGATPAASSRPATPSEDGEWFAFVACYCGGFSTSAHTMASGGTESEARQAAIAAWNTRHTPAAEGELPPSPQTGRRMGGVGDV